MGATLTLDGQSYRGAEGNISNVDPGFLMLQLSAHVTVGRVNHEATCNLTRFDSSVTDCGWCNEKECIFNVSEARYYDKISIYDYDPYGSTNFYIDIKGIAFDDFKTNSSLMVNNNHCMTPGDRMEVSAGTVDIKSTIIEYFLATTTCLKTSSYGKATSCGTCTSATCMFPLSAARGGDIINVKIIPDYYEGLNIDYEIKVKADVKALASRIEMRTSYIVLLAVAVWMYH